MSDIQTNIIAIANHKGGCGKTTTAVNLAAELGRHGLSVLLIDMDPQANASLHIGLHHPAEVEVTCAEMLLGGFDLLPKAIHEETTLKNVSLIYGSLSLGRAEDDLRESTPRPSEELAYKINPLLGIYDLIIIDCPPSLKLLSSNALAAATHIIVPVESGSQYGLYGVNDLLAHISKIKRINPRVELMGALLIRHDARYKVCQLIEEAAQEQLGHLIPVKIPRSTKVNQSVILKTSIYGLDAQCTVSEAFIELGHYMIDRLQLPAKKMSKKKAKKNTKKNTKKSVKTTKKSSKISKKNTKSTQSK